MRTKERDAKRLRERARILQAFGDEIRRRRVRLGVSQEELAFRAGLDRTYVSSLERGHRNVSLVNLHRLAEALDVRPRDLLP